VDADSLGLIEMLLVFGAVLGFGVHQLWSVRRSQREDAARRKSPPS
jgi:hypothetical protein